MIDLKSPKEAKGSSVRVELFANGTKSCPVKAYKKLLQFWGHGKHWNIPLMTKKDGTMFSGCEFNKLLTPLTSNIEKPNLKRNSLSLFPFWHPYTDGQSGLSGS